MNDIPNALRGWRPRPLPAAVGASLLIGVAAVAVAFDWNWFKGPLERYVSVVTGRAFMIRGDLDVDLGSVMRVDGMHVLVGNAPWASPRHLARVDRVRIDIALAQPSQRRITFGEPVVHEGTVRLREPRLRTDLLVNVHSARRGANEASAQLVATGAGRYRDGGFTLSARVDSPLHLLEHGRAYRVDVRARAGATRARVHGSVPAPIDPDRFDLQAEFSGQDLADLYPLLGLPVPESPPYELRGSLARSGRLIHHRNFEGVIGDSDVRGDLTMVLGGERIYARGDLVSDHLDFDDLAVLLGAPPDTGAGETANARQEAEARRRGAEVAFVSIRSERAAGARHHMRSR